MQLLGIITIRRSDVPAQIQGQRSKGKVTDLKIYFVPYTIIYYVLSISLTLRNIIQHGTHSDFVAGGMQWPISIRCGACNV